MSFLSILQDIRKGLHIGVAVVEPYGKLLDGIPGLGNILSAIEIADELIPGVGVGVNKKQVATAIITAGQLVADPSQLSVAIDSLVAALKALKQAQLTPSPIPPAMPVLPVGR